MKKTTLLLCTLLFITSFSCEQAPIPAPSSEINMFIAIHNEPGSFNAWGDYQEEKWPALVSLVESADGYGHTLTLLFNPQWATYILDNEERLALVRQWESHGHELGVHCHGVNTQVNWNGYTNNDEYKIRQEYLGTMQDMMDLLNRLPVSGQMKTSATTDDSSEIDYPPGIIYDVDGGASEYEDLVSTPFALTWGDSELIGLKHARFTDAAGSGISVGTDDILTAMQEYEEGQVLGIVFHTFEYYDNPGPYDLLFAFLAERGVHTKTVSSILEESFITAD